ncbi:hypothetical protein OGAPHI_005420 [Ogataea philodendri]|uniref:Uracil permease n=1 Tax=Ogataea philodendri TaxID=1378263 RepID=A0A9P8NZP2_9ASCO|nr:uncharacterized protein OGAPHI_005420 [Ogataea philodendri]KAH3662172.1 hypothetical protein OGAPHI_005420 [Ogataea philodendri]
MSQDWKLHDLGIPNPFNDPWIVRVIRNPEHLPMSELLAVPKDEDSEYENDRWTNRDLIPIPKDRQTWTSLSYFGYWAVAGMGIPGWSMGASALAYGLNCKQALGAIAGGSMIVGLIAVLIGVIGQRCRIGYTVSSRAIFGFYGCFLPIAIKSFIACIWQGLHFYYMGQGFVGTLGALSPVFITGSMGEPFSSWSPLTKNELVGVFLAIILFSVTMLIPPEKMQPMVHISFVLQTGSFFGMMGWAIHANHGKLGPLWSESGSQDVNPTWAAFYMISNMCGSSSGVLGQSDWTRYAKTKFAPNFSQIITAPVTMFLTAAMGIFASAAMEPVLGAIYWNPLTLLPKLLTFYDFSPAVRAGVFFASFGIVSGQLWQAVLLTACSTGMDISGFAPRYINIRRGSYVMTVIGLCCQPWKLLATSNTFLTVLSGFAVFVGPLVGGALADFFVVRRMKYKLCDLYRTEPSIYWTKWGLNWRGLLSFTLGFAPTIAGLACTAGNYYMSPGYERFYNLNYLVGLFISFFAHSLICYVFPPPGLGLEAPFAEIDDQTEVYVSEKSGFITEVTEKDGSSSV